MHFDSRSRKSRDTRQSVEGKSWIVAAEFSKSEQIASIEQSYDERKREVKFLLKIKKLVIFRAFRGFKTFKHLDNGE